MRYDDGIPERTGVNLSAEHAARINAMVRQAERVARRDRRRAHERKPAPQLVIPQRANLGKRLKAAREVRRVTQRELGAVVGQSRDAVSSWENGRYEPAPDLLARACAYLGVSPADLAAPPSQERRERPVGQRGAAASLVTVDAA
ncbi:MAG TPA: helix-turn-helix transcriptional regulator [Tepidisphaeraceae bacterium]|jgi:DNA-binding XRE family transcriptional regulator|nr:helix-turn-helix transcriptional regulator [Tepidisphaeraceae bacterium]